MAKCTVCRGNKVIPSGGAWSTIYDEDAKECPHCGGSGEEPEQKPTQSSPFEDEGMGIGSSNNP